MPIIIPIEDESAGVAPLATAAGAGIAQATLSVANRLRAVAHGTSEAAASLRLGPGGALALAGVASGTSESSASLRLNGEANVDLAGASAGASQTAATLAVRAGLAGVARGASEAAARLSVRRAEEFGFTVFVDVLSASLSNALSNPANIRRFTARLTASGVPVPIIRAEESASPDRLGTELTVVLARPDVGAVSSSASVDFEIGVWTGAGFEYLPRLTGARLSGRGARYANEEGLPADSVELSFVDVLGDRWNRRPAANTLLYDPDKVDAPQSTSLSELSIVDERGGVIAPDVRAWPGLSLLSLLNFCYVTGCGFSKVVTNVEDFPLEQASVTITGGYDAAVRPFLSSYDIVPRVVNNDLWLIDTSAPLPAGLSPRAFPASLTLALEDELPRREPVTAILVHLKGDAAGDYTTERVETPPAVESPAGGFGTPGFTSTSVEKRVREWRSFAAPETILREETVSVTTTVEDFEFNVVSRDTRLDSFDALGRRTGYTRTVEQRLPDVSADGALVLRKVAEETQLITYTPDPRDTRRDLEDRVETRKSGLILVDEDKPYLGKPYRLPLDDAHRSGYVDPEANQRTEFGPISTEFLELKIRGQQVTRERRVYNAITDAVEPSSVQTLPADNYVERKGAQTRSVLIRIGDDSGTLRRVPEFDGTGLPDDLALKLARRRLALLNNPQRDATVRMAYVDPLMGRGADLRLYGRASEPVGDYIVRGYSAVFSSEGGGEFEASMTISAKELRQ